MPRLKFLLFVTSAAVLLLAGAAPAQTVANLSPVSGNGQLTCPGCSFGSFTFFEPLQLKATDAAGNPVANLTVNWAATANVNVESDLTTTDQNGLTQNTIIAAGGAVGSTYLQSAVTASVGSLSVTFTETQGLGGSYYILPSLVSPVPGTSYTGAAGSQGSPAIQLHVANAYSGIPGVSVRLVSITGGAPAMSCVTGAGADPGSVLTDANGNATCTPLFGSTVGYGQSVVALVGGVNSSVFNNGLPYGFWASSAFFVTVTPATVGSIAKVSGDGQSANPGQSLASPLQVVVKDAAGVATIAGVGLTWSVTPATAATLAASATITDANGLSQNTVQLAAGAAGQFQVTAAVTNAPTLSTTFTVTANATITGLTKSSGDGQSAVVNTAFGNPLVVLVNGSNGQPLANYGVTFSVSGPATLSAASVPTDNNGHASVTVTAGSSVGTVTVTATAGTFTQTFTLTVAPVGPRITSFTNGAQFYTSYDANHSALSPCGIGTAYGTGIAPSLQGVATASDEFGPLPYTLAGVSISFNNSQAPIFNVANINGVQSVTFQAPCDVTPGPAVSVTVHANGGTANLTAIVRAAGPGIFEWVQSDGVLRAVLEKLDGSLVTPANPARRGDTIRMFATGLGVTAPPVSGTDGLPPIGVDAIVRAQLIVGVDNGGSPLIEARYSQDLIGIYIVDFQVPMNSSFGDNIVLSLAANPIDPGTGLPSPPTQFSGGSRIPVHQ